MMLNNRLGSQKRRSGIAVRDLHGQEVRLLHCGCLNGAAEGIGSQLLHNGFPQNRAVDDLRKRRGQTGRGRKVLVNRGGALLYGHHKRGSGGVLGHIIELRHRIGAHAHDQGRRHNQIPAAQHIPQDDNGIKGHKRDGRFLLGYFILRHASILHNHDQPRHSGVGSVRNGIVHAVGARGVGIHIGIDINVDVLVIPTQGNGFAARLHGL